MEKETVVYYHNDLDGFGAAFACWLALGYDGVSYVAHKHGEGAFELPAEHYGKRLIFLDFWPGVIMPEVSDDVLVIDHHKRDFDVLGMTNMEMVDGVDSTALLAWEHFHAGKEIPIWAMYISEYDCWTFGRPMVKEYILALELVAKDFNVWNLSVHEDDDAFERLCRDGMILIGQQDIMVGRLAKKARPVVIFDTEVLAANCIIWPNEICVEIMEAYNVDVAATYYDDPDRGQKWCLRSRAEGPSVKVLAEAMGGGGHYHAAGFVETDRIKFV